MPRISVIISPRDREKYVLDPMAGVVVLLVSGAFYFRQAEGSIVDSI
jgi:hypothetical protein